MPPFDSFPALSGREYGRLALNPIDVAQILFRFSAPLSNVAGTITDLVPTAQSGYAIALYALASVVGPALGSVMGGYPVEILGWRWLFWIYAIVFGVHLFIIWAFMPETRENISA